MLSGWPRVAGLASVALSAGTAPAAADPISIGFFLFSGPLGSIFSFSALVTASQIGLYAVATGVAAGLSALSRRQAKTNPGDYKNTFETGNSSEVNAIGRVRLGGLKAFGNTKLYDRYRLIWHCKGPLIGIERTFLGGREVTMDETGLVTTPPYAKVDGTSFVQILVKAGDGTETAWAALISAFPQLWTSDHTCKGIFQSLVKYVSPGIYTPKFGKLYANGTPDIEHIARVLTSYDPRDEGQDPDDPSTWTWTDNGPLCAARVMLQYPDLTVGSFDWTFIAAEATKADVLVATKTGTEPRSRCSGVWLSEARRGDTMQDVLDSTGTEIVISPAGLIRIRLIDDVPTSELTLEAQHQSEFVWKSGPDAVERPNVCVVKYYAPELNYELGEIDMTGIAWARIDDEVTRYGEKQFVVELPFCFSASQAQRIARRLFALERADSGKVLMNWTGLAAWGAVYATIEDETGEESHLCRIAPPRIDDAEGQVDIPYAVWPELPAWNPATDEAAAPEQVPEFQSETDLAKPATPTAASIVQYAGGGYETRMKAATVTGASTDPAFVNAVMRTYGGSIPNPFTRMTAYFAGTTIYAWKAIDGRTRADFKIQLFTPDEEASYFSDLLSVNPLAIDNSAPATPVLDVDATFDNATNEWTFDCDVSCVSMNVALLKLQRLTGGVWSDLDTWDARPEQIENYTFTEADPSVGTVTISLRAFAYSSNGTASTASTFTQII